MIQKAVFLAIATLCLQAWGAITVDPAEGAVLVGSCQQLSQSAYLVRTGRYSKAGLVSGRLLVTSQYYENYKNEVLGYLDKGTKFEVLHLIKDKNLTSSCWRIEVEILDGKNKGVISELPACYTEHPPTWLNSIGPGGQFKGMLGIKPEYAEPC